MFLFQTLPQYNQFNTEPYGKIYKKLLRKPHNYLNEILSFTKFIIFVLIGNSNSVQMPYIFLRQDIVRKCKKNNGIFLSFRIFFSDNKRVRIFIFLSRQAQIFFPELNIRLYDKNSESDYFFFLHQNQNIFSATLGIRIFFFRKKAQQPLGTPVSSTNKTDRHDITEILLKVALNTTSHLFLQKMLVGLLCQLQRKIYLT